MSSLDMNKLPGRETSLKYPSADIGESCQVYIGLYIPSYATFIKEESIIINSIFSFDIETKRYLVNGIYPIEQIGHPDRRTRGDAVISMTQDAASNTTLDFNTHYIQFQESMTKLGLADRYKFRIIHPCYQYDRGY